MTKTCNKKKLLKIVLCALVAIILIVVVGFIIDAQNYYRAGDAAQTALKGDDKVTVSEITDAGAYGWFIDGPATDKAIIFYPGAKVDTIAYLPVLMMIAEEDADVFLIDMPLHYAFFGLNKADKIMAAYSYDEWYMSGHSLGAAMSGVYASKHLDELAGVIMLAGYPSKSLKHDGFSLLSIYGTNDGNVEMLQKGKDNRPDDYSEVVIDGGNHAQFGDYGLQKGDGTAKIDPQKQWDETAEAIKKFLNN